MKSGKYTYEDIESITFRGNRIIQVGLNYPEEVFLSTTQSIILSQLFKYRKLLGYTLYRNTLVKYINSSASYRLRLRISRSDAKEE